MTDHLNPPEFSTLKVGWIVTLVLWFLLIVIAVCEPDLNDDGGICIFYTYKYDGNYTTTDAESSSTGDSMDGGTVPDYKYNRKVFFFVILSIACFCYLNILIFSITTMYLSNRVDMTIEEYQRHLIDARPTCWLKIECWHRGSKNKRVVTKREKEEFQFASFKSHCCVTGVGVTRKEEKEEEEVELQEYVSFNDQCEERSAPSAAGRIRITTKLEFLDGQTRTAYKDQLDSFVRQHTSDKNQTISEDLSVPKCDKFVLVVSPDKTLFMHTAAFYYLCVLLTLGMPYATYFYWSIEAVELVVTKEVSLTQNGDENAPTDRVVDFDNKQIERV